MVEGHPEDEEDGREMVARLSGFGLIEGDELVMGIDAADA